MEETISVNMNMFRRCDEFYLPGFVPDFSGVRFSHVQHGHGAHCTRPLTDEVFAELDRVRLDTGLYIAPHGDVWGTVSFVIEPRGCDSYGSEWYSRLVVVQLDPTKYPVLTEWAGFQSPNDD
jgi:hypothetical protein